MKNTMKTILDTLVSLFKPRTIVVEKEKIVEVEKIVEKQVPIKVVPPNIGLFEFAMGLYGQKEVFGKSSNKTILKMIKDLDSSVSDDETAWCSAFANFCCAEKGLPKSGKLNARSWVKVGKKADVPRLMDIVVFWRESPDSWKGHVGFWIGETNETVFVLGGNQGDRVSIAEFSKSRILDIRRITEE